MGLGNPGWSVTKGSRTLVRINTLKQHGPSSSDDYLNYHYTISYNWYSDIGGAILYRFHPILILFFRCGGRENLSQKLYPDPLPRLTLQPRIFDKNVFNVQFIEESYISLFLFLLFRLSICCFFTSLAAFSIFFCSCCACRSAALASLFLWAAAFFSWAS